ncbi:MAG: hypothetical protein IT353_22745 [Gemmatimonadaceae bacterium]|nr:hypothetical protein [Gemmatimonadaceae bacterium]
MTESRRFRGMFGMATTWGVALSVLATGTLALGIATGLVPSSIFGAREFVAVAVRGLLVGAVAGGLFGWLLARRERGQSLTTLSSRRVGLWGFVAAGSLVPPLALTATGPTLSLGVLTAAAVGYGGIGALLSTATLRIARRGQARLEGPDEEFSRLEP